VARLVGRYAVTLIGRIDRARPTIVGRSPSQQLRGIAGSDDILHKRCATQRQRANPNTLR
jgi:hypothetical protein